MKGQTSTAARSSSARSPSAGSPSAGYPSARSSSAGSLSGSPHAHDISTCSKHYIEEVLLGKGGAGKVQKCKHNLDEKYYAVKMIPYNEENEKERLNTLSDAFKEKRDFSLDETEKMFKGMAKALECIHEKDVIHCDISPDNIFLDSQGEAKIGDFGLAEVLRGGGSCISSERKGKTLYYAPELDAKDGDEKPIVEFSKATDVYALALVMLLVMYPSDTDMGKKKMFDRVREGIFPELNDKGRLGMYLVIKKMLSFNAANRPTASDVVNAFAF